MADPRVELHPSVWSGGGVASGHEGVRRWLLQFGAGVDDLRLELDEIVVEGDRALALGTAYDSREQRPYAQRLGWILEFDDGLIYRARSYATWDEARAAL